MMLAQHPARRLDYGELTTLKAGCRLTPKEAGFEPLSLTAAEFELARLFDGQRNGATIAALGGVSAAEIERLAQRLAGSGLLLPGRYEPLPAPPQYASSRAPRATARQLGGAMLPSTLPGTLSGPNFIGSLTGLFGWERGDAAALDVTLDVRGLRWIGAALNLFLWSSVRVWLLLALQIGAILVIYNHRFEMARDFSQLLQPTQLVFGGIVGAYLVDFLAKLARYAAIARATHTRPRFGISLGGLGLPVPHFYADTSGAAEAADRAVRMRIVGAELTALMTMFVGATTVWLMFQRHGSVLAPLSVGMMFMLTTFFIVQLNPLGMRSGYQLLMLWLRVGDLREHRRGAQDAHDPAGPRGVADGL